MQYVVEGFIRVKMTVEADSEDEAMEMAAENFSHEKHVDEEVEPEWETANPLESSDDEDEVGEDFSSGYKRSSYDDEDDDN